MYIICYSGALTLLVGRQEGHPCKKTERWGAGVVICLEQSVDLHTAQLMPLPLTVSCFSKVQIGFTFRVPAHLGSPGQRAVKWVLLCNYSYFNITKTAIQYLLHNPPGILTQSQITCKHSNHTHTFNHGTLRSSKDQGH